MTPFARSEAAIRSAACWIGPSIWVVTAARIGISVCTYACALTPLDSPVLLLAIKTAHPSTDLLAGDTPSADKCASLLFAGQNFSQLAAKVKAHPCHLPRSGPLRNLVYLCLLIGSFEQFGASRMSVEGSLPDADAAPADQVVLIPAGPLVLGGDL